MKILIIDDHPMIVDAYITTLSQKKVFPEIPKFTVVNTCEEAYLLIDGLTDVNSFDLAIIDQRLPPFAEKNILCGTDLALLLKKKKPRCKIIMCTSHSEILLLYSILKKVEPQGFIVKSDLDSERLCAGILKVLQGLSFYSSTVAFIIAEIEKKELLLDECNRHILEYLYKGYKIEDLTEFVPLSVSSIKRRIALLKEAFAVRENSSLLREVLLQGFL